MTDLRQRISNALAAFSNRSLAEAAVALFETLGYRSEKRISLQPNTVEHFLSTFGQGASLPVDCGVSTEAQTVDFLFQITDDEIRQASGQDELPFDSKSKWNGAAMESYLFLAVGLKGAAYTRTRLSAITREINRLFPMPAMLLFRHGDTLTLAIIRRRLHKRDDSRDVLERKVTLIKDIRFADPLRAHIEILNDLSLPALYEEFYFHNFVGLHLGWEKRLDTYQLNERFYRDVANWYFWALQHPDIRFPRAIATIRDKDEREKQQSIFLIRLLTRLIFCWFLQEKRLIPRDLFRRRVPEEVLIDFKPRAGAYYRAFLQNLFFGTLNQEIDKRRFRKKNPAGRDPDHGITNIYRYEDLFAPGRAKVFLEMLRRIPFVNGGLFDCLDTVFKKEEDRPDIRLDDFSEEAKSMLCVPNELFFCDEHPEDLCDAYGDSRRSKEKVRGLIDILSRYKFTMEENTPLEEEIALDPELLGKVFENLLASYNEDTRTTARKALGAFYTPRDIVSYMVDESLIAYLKTAAFPRATPAMTSADAGSDSTTAANGHPIETKLRSLLSPSALPADTFTPKEVESLIAAIDRVKVLDPACGSGAFPMGVLHRLVDLLGKLDPNNRRWKERQLAKVQYDRKLAERMQDDDDREASLREIAVREEDVKRSFDSRFHALDFARKLYLIENCIYGVDILPIACQIAKLRFFIALIVDQNLDADDKNLGFRPLPNLETKIVAADTLIPIERTERQADMFREDTQAHQRIKVLRVELQSVRHEHFNARTPEKKARCRRRDAELRAEISGLLEKAGHTAAQSRQLAAWDPYDQNHHASFFDPEWMFGLPVGKVRITNKSPATLRGNLALINETTGQMELAGRGVDIESGFDVVIGNPPYVLLQAVGKTGNQLGRWRALYRSAKYKVDLYQLFLECGIRLLRPKGVLAFITPNTFLKNKFSADLRAFLLNESQPLGFLLFRYQVFPGQAVDNAVSLFQKCAVPSRSSLLPLRSAIIQQNGALTAPLQWRLTPRSRIKPPSYELELDVDAGSAELLERIDSGTQALGEFCGAYFGIQTFDRERYVSPERKGKSFRQVIDGTNVHRWWVEPPVEYVDFRSDAIKSGGDEAIYTRERIVVRQIGAHPEGSICPPGLLTLNTIYNIYETKPGNGLPFLLAILNSSTTAFYWSKRFSDSKETFPKIKKTPLLSIRVPACGPDQRRLVERWVNVLRWASGESGARIAEDPRDTLMLGYWEQLINGLVYELFFPDELHDAQVRLFDLVAQASLPALDSIPESKRLACLRQEFERLYDLKHPIRAALHALRSLETVRIIEGEE